MGTSNRKTNIMEEGNLNKIFLKNHVENGINVRGELQFLTNHRDKYIMLEENLNNFLTNHWEKVIIYVRVEFQTLSFKGNDLVLIQNMLPPLISSVYRRLLKPKKRLDVGVVMQLKVVKKSNVGCYLIFLSNLFFWYL